MADGDGQSHPEGIDCGETDAGVIRLDADQRYTTVSPIAAAMLDRPRDELIGERVLNRLPDLPGIDFEAISQHAMTTQQGYRIERTGPDGSTAYSVQLAPDEDGLTVSLTDHSARDDTSVPRRPRETQLLSLVEHSPEAIFVKDAEGRFEFVNDAAAALFGLDPADMVDRFDGDFFTTSDAAEIREIDARVIETGTGDTRETDRHIDGKRRVFLEHTYPHRDPDGAIVGVMGISREITDRTDREADLQRRHDRLDEFASVISHDLINPLTVAQGRLALVRAESDSEHLDALGAALDRIESMVGDTLRLARQGDVVADTEPVWITDIVANCWAMIGADDATLKLVDEFAIVADADRLRHVFENLFRNAIVHGGPTVTVRIGRLNDGFYVEDDGPGIPERMRDAVFDPGHKSTAGGTGFGLTIVRRIADAHGWTVAIREGTDGGARFEFTGVDVSDEN